MAILESVYFNFDGKYSSDFGIINVSLQNGMFQETFAPNRKINEVTIRGNSKPYFQSVEYEPLTLKLTFAFEGSWDNEKIREVSRWLVQDYYKPLWFSENPDRIFYCMIEGDSQLFHNGLKQGYITLEMRCDSAYSYSPVYSTQLYDLSSNPVEGTQIEFLNKGDIICKPEIFITKIGAGDFRIVNTSNEGKEFKFTGLQNNESVYVDCDGEYIETDITNMYRYDAFNNTYLELLVGKNVLIVYGNAKINFRYKFKTLQG